MQMKIQNPPCNIRTAHSRNISLELPIPLPPRAFCEYNRAVNNTTLQSKTPVYDSLSRTGNNNTVRFRPLATATFEAKRKLIGRVTFKSAN